MKGTDEHPCGRRKEKLEHRPYDIWKFGIENGTSFQELFGALLREFLAIAFQRKYSDLMASVPQRQDFAENECLRPAREEGYEISDLHFSVSRHMK
jgi:hypothetical protein